MSHFFHSVDWLFQGKTLINKPRFRLFWVCVLFGHLRRKIHMLLLSHKHCRYLICFQSSHKAPCQSIVVHLIFLWGTRAWSFLVQLKADVTYHCFKVLISQRLNFFSVPWLFYCILLPIISYPQVSTDLYCPCSSYMSATLPL